MKLAFICHPLGASTHAQIALNIKSAELYAQHVLKMGYVPVVPHWYARILDDTKPEQRCLGIICANKLAGLCDVAFMCGDVISSGMAVEMSVFKERRVPFAWICLEDNKLIIREDKDKIYRG